ncbi:MAG: tRNA (guanosine(37)-N1)-methyltransferase TrmD [Tagaea sp.]
MSEAKNIGGADATGGKAAPWRACVLTIFPEMFPGVLGHSLVGKALADGVWSLDTIDIRDYARDKHRSVDDIPFGGGPGMVMKPDVVDAALDAALSDARHGTPAFYLSPRGVPFDQARARDLASGPGVVLLCGRFEGIDQRVLDKRGLAELSLGDFVLSGGEPAAMCVLDSCVRLLPGVLGASDSLGEESFEEGLLEYPHYTRPAAWDGRDVPAILTSGHHANIKAWRRAQAEKLTAERRPDLWAKRAAPAKH